MNKEMVVLVVVVVVVQSLNSHTLEFLELKKNNISFIELMHSNGDQIEWFS